MSRKTDLSKLFPGLNSGPPQLKSPGTSSESQGAQSHSRAMAHFQNLLASPTATPATPPPTFPVTKGNENVYVVKDTSAYELPVTKVTLVKSESTAYSIGARAAMSAEYICYTTKGGIRALHTETVARALLKGHENAVQDIKFSPKKSGMLLSVAGDDCGIVWEMRVDPAQKALQFREAIRLRSKKPTSVSCWHPVDERTFALGHGSSLSVVTLSSMLWARQQEEQEVGIPLEEARSCFGSFSSDVTCVDMDQTQLVGGSSNGSVKIFPLDSSGQMLTQSIEIQLGSAPQTVRILSSNTLLTGSHGNSLWGIYENGNCVDTLRVEAENPRMVASIASGYLFIADIDHPVLLCSKLNGKSFGRVAQYHLETPVLSMSTFKRGNEIDIVCQHANGIQYLTFDGSSYASASNASSSGSSTPVHSNGTPKPAPVPTASIPAVPSVTPNVPPSPASAALHPANMPVSPASTGLHAANPTVSMTSRKSTTSDMPKPSTKLHTLEKQGSDLFTPAQLMTPRGTGTPPPLSSSEQGKAFSFNDTTAVSKQLQALQESIIAELDARQEKDVVRQKKLLELISSSFGSVVEEVEESVKEALSEDALLDNLSSRLLEPMTSNLQSLVNNAVQDALTDKQIAAKVARNLQSEIGNIFKKQFTDSLVPAFEAGCNSMISQLQGAIVGVTNENMNMLAMMQKMMEQQASMNTRLEQLEQLGSMSTPEKQIKDLLDAERYEEAFMQALNMQDLNIVLFTCRNVNVNEIFESKHKSRLPQYILFSLTQQLCADLSVEPGIKLDWIRRAALALDPQQIKDNDHYRELMESTIGLLDQQRNLFDSEEGPNALETMRACVFKTGILRLNVGIPRQNPSLFFMPGLESNSFWNLPDPRFAWIDQLQSERNVIYQEYLQAKDAFFSDYGEESHKLHDGDWRWHSFIQKGQWQPKMESLCPKTFQMLKSIPDIMTDIPFSYVFFSTLKAQSAIASHFGPSNLRVRLHLPLQVPSNATKDTCAFRVGNESRVWENGKAMLFDDSYDHEAYNHTDEDRVVLLIDVWNPTVHKIEREAIMEMFRSMKK